jgi:hypothetical protein
MRTLLTSVTRRMGFNPIAWLRDARRVRSLISAFNACGGENQRGPAGSSIAVVLVPWLGTAVPWFSLVCGVFFGASGSRVTFVVDDLRVGPSRLRFQTILRSIRWALRALEGRYRIVNLSDYRGGADLKDSERAAVEALAQLNAIWTFRGEMVEANRLQFIAAVRDQLMDSYRAITRFFDAATHDAVFVPGGVYGSSGAWSAICRARGVRLASFDSGGYGTLMLAAQGIACQLQDIPRAHALLKARAVGGEEAAFIMESARTEIDKRRRGIDSFASQMQGAADADEKFNGAVLIALNSSWDSAALGLHAVFKSSEEWIVETTRHLLATTEVPVIVRQHPAERLPIARTTDNYRELLDRHFSGHPRVHFIAADQPVNSYALLNRVSSVVVHTSTIGIEAAIQRKVVVTASRSYYSEMGFVWAARSLSQYQEHLSNAVAGRYAVTPLMQEDALYCYYLTQCCNWVFSPFNPEGFSDWSRYDLQELRKHRSVQATVESVQSNIPVAFINHLSRFAARSEVE